MVKPGASIGDVAERFGMKPSALRFYEEIGLLEPAWRRSGRRYYGTSELKRLALIHMLQGAGLMKLDDIGAIIDAKMERPGWHEMLARQVEALENQIENARQAVEFLKHMATCPRDNPARDCPVVGAKLEEIVNKTSSRSAP